LLAIYKFNPEAARIHALTFIANPSNGVRTRSATILARNSDHQTLEKLRSIYAASPVPVMITILRLFNQIGGYPILPDLLLALREETSELQELGWYCLEKWKVKATRLFTKPARPDMERASRICNSLEYGKLTLTPSRIELLEELKFYIR
jgi:hypothetical protein